MSDDKTIQQSTDEQKGSEDLSRKARRPPAEVTGYTIEGIVGSGAYGEVWSAVDRKTGRQVAIKFYTRQTTIDFSLLSREVEKLAYLSADRYVVQLLDVGWDAKPPYFVMDYIETGSLEDELKRNSTLSTKQAVDVFEEIAIGLMHLHSKGILHCDLKPGNVLLDQDFKPRLADFGQSRLSHEQVPSLGTLFFMAPEQADLNAAPDAKWDVYALGALLYCMLSGHPPYREDETLKKIESSGHIEDRLSMYRQLIAEAPKPMAHRKVPGVDRALADIIDRCIARDPKERFASVQSVLYAMQAREDAHSRRPLVVLGVVGPLLLLLIVSLFAWNAYQRALSQSDQAITERTLTSNRWAAKLAARTASSDIEEYFRVVRDLAHDPELIHMMKELAEDEKAQEMIAQLSDPADNTNDDLNLLRDEFEIYPPRERLDNRLLKNLRDPTFPLAASWFICDPTGTQIASKFNFDNPSRTLGKNYSYRTYFTGADRDAVRDENGKRVFEVADDPTDRTFIERPHLSAIFKSKATQNWKVAFSVPVRDSDGRFLGIVAVTADMGSFIDFENGVDQYAMLVDTREGDFKGAVLEHPLIHSVIEDAGEWPERLNSIRVDLGKFESQDSDLQASNFQDPFGYDREYGQTFDRRWIAAQAPVQISDFSTTQTKKEIPTGLVVIAMEDYQSAMAPTRKLGSQMGRTGVFALLTFLAVTCCLLLFVSRFFKTSRERFARHYLQNGESTSIHDQPTLQSPSKTN